MNKQKQRLFEIMGHLNPTFNILNESLSSNEQNIINDILSVNEGENDWWNKFINYGKKGLLTAGIVLSIAFSSAAQQDNKINDVINYGIENTLPIEKNDIINFIIGIATENLTLSMKNSDIDGAAAYKELITNFTNKRDNKSSQELSTSAKKHLSIIKNLIKHLDTDTINHFIDVGKNRKTL